MLVLSAAASALLAPLAHAETVHRTSTTFDGQTLSLAYEPKAVTTYRQLDVGPRGTPRCLWTTRITVERTVTGADNQPVAALGRKIQADAKPRQGSVVGYCGWLSSRADRQPGVDREKLTAIGAEVAQRDSATIGTELAGLGPLLAAR